MRVWHKLESRFYAWGVLCRSYKSYRSRGYGLQLRCSRVGRGAPEIIRSSEMRPRGPGGWYKPLCGKLQAVLQFQLSPPRSRYFQILIQDELGILAKSTFSKIRSVQRNCFSVIPMHHMHFLFVNSDFIHPKDDVSWKLLLCMDFWSSWLDVCVCVFFLLTSKILKIPIFFVKIAFFFVKISKNSGSKLRKS